MNAPSHSLRARLALATVSFAAALCALEGIVRIAIPQDLGLLAPWYKSDPVYRFRHYPNMDTLRTWGNPYRLRTDSHGVRSDREEPYVSPSEIRVVIHGDSLTFGVGVDDRETFVRRTEQYLRQQNEGIDVLNLGVSGHSPDLEYLLFREEGRRYSPKVCVIAVCLGNDLDELGWSRAAFRLAGGHLDFVPYTPPLAKRMAEQPIYRWLATRSHLLALARYRLIDAPTYAREADAQQYRSPPLPLALAIFSQFTAAIRAEGAVPVILLLPTRGQIAEQRHIPPEESFAAAVMLRDALLQFCMASDVMCLDALEVLGRAPTSFDELFIRGDDHFSAAGHQVIADVLKTALARILE